MFLFKEIHVRMILTGTKTQTRRNHKQFRARVGSIHQVRTELFGRAHCRIRVLRRWEEPLGAISPEDARAEGLYQPEEYIAGMIEMHQGRLTRKSSIKCYEFELMKEGQANE